MTDPRTGKHEIDSQPRARRRRPRLSVLAAGMALGFALSVVTILVLLVLFYRDPTPVLTDESLEAAIRRWRQNGPASYNLDVTITGRQPGRVHIEVRDGTVTAMTRDGVTPRQRRTWEYWTVPGQLDTIQQDMASALEPAGGFGAPAGSQVAMRAQFDEALGYPVKYRRRVLGTQLAVEWEIERFETVR